MKKINFSIKNIVSIGFLLGFALVLIKTPYTKAQTSASEASAPTSYTVLAPLPCIESPATDNNPGVTCDGGNGSLQTKLDFKTYVQYTINLLIGLSAVVAVVMMVWGGVEYMYNASFQGKKDGLERAKNAITGFVLILTSYIIMRTIDPRLVEIPNSLVPQITINEYLARDANQLLMNQVQSDFIRSQIKGINNAKEMAKTVADIKITEKNITETQNQMAQLDKNSTEYKDLEIKMRLAQEEKSKLEIQRAVEGAKGDIIGQLIQSQTDILNNDTYDTTKAKLEALELSKTGISKLRNERSKVLTSLGQLNIKPVNDLANYAEAVIDINKINLVILSASRTSDTSKIIDIGDKNLGTKQFISDGVFAKPRLTARQKANDYMQKQIDYIQGIQNGLTTDNDIKKDLQDKIDIATKSLNSSSAFHD
jgi:hypothetical protein